MTGIRLDDITKSFGKTPDSVAVKGVSLEVASGEFFTFLGPSGCGKTTTLRMVAGFYYPTSGELFFDDDQITRRPPHKRGTGMVFQNYALFPHLSVAENVAYGLKVRKVPAQERTKRIENALEEVHLAGYGRRRIDELSGGQQQRVALARALVIRPRVLLLDEPLSNLDAKLREETRREIRRIQQEAGTTALYVTHDQAEAMAVSDRMAVMEDGIVHQVGTPLEIYRTPRTEFVARFIGNSNVVKAQVVGSDGERHRLIFAAGERVVEHEVVLPEHVQPTDGTVSVSVRPEHMSIVSPEDPDSLPATVSAVEFTGLLTYVTAEMGDQQVQISLADAYDAPEVGDRVGISLRRERLLAVAS